MMKKVFLVFNLFLSFLSFLSFSQELKKPSEGKAMVYFIRSDQMGFLINFKYFDGEKYLGKFNYGKYIAYECEPGKHMFWSKSENIDFVDADLEAGKIYIIDSEPQIGAFKLGVKLVPFDNNQSSFKNEKKYNRVKKRILESIIEKEAYFLSKEDEAEAKIDLENLIKRAMEKYNKRKTDGDEITVLPITMNYPQ